jgi:regulator of cell morphogenesis and NO signaling
VFNPQFESNELYLHLLNQKRNTMFTRKMKLADVVQANFNTLSVISRFDIMLGFGDKSVERICAEHGINVDFFLEILNAFHDHNYFPQRHLQSFSVIEIVDYLRKTHQSYIRENIPYIEMLMEQLVKECSNSQEIGLVQKFFTEYKQELFKHLSWEDEKIFPYTLSVEKAFNEGLGLEQVVSDMQKFTMSEFLDEHDDVESKLNDIKTLFVKYLPPVIDQPLCIRILREFSLLEKDINDHARIEEKVLAPKVVEMEKSLIAG